MCPATLRFGLVPRVSRIFLDAALSWQCAAWLWKQDNEDPREPLLLSAVRPAAEHDQPWPEAFAVGTRWCRVERARHSAMGPKHSLAIEIFTLTRSGRHGWSLIVAKEYWWAGDQGNKALKNLRWARSTSGQRGDILHWCARRKPRSIVHRPNQASYAQLAAPSQRTAKQMQLMNKDSERQLCLRGGEPSTCFSSIEAAVCDPVLLAQPKAPAVQY